ncbi:MAG: c-type cytochrome [bacterium]|nr:c-type cytochrome [bacterium]
MKKALIYGLTLAFAVFSASSLVWAKDGKTLFKEKLCVACHGPAGASKTPQYPHLAGQNKLYLINQFNAIIYGKRELGSTPLMKNHPKLKDFTPQDIDSIAEYLSGLPRVVTPSGSAADVAKGEALFKNLGCTQCHGAGGKGKGDDPKFLAYPKLNGQHADYLFWQMKRILEGVRTNNHALKMREQFQGEKLTEKDLHAIAIYLSNVK